MTIARFAILLVALFVLLPNDAGQKTRLWEQTKDFTNWTMTTCDRDPQSCEQADRLWRQFQVNAAHSFAVINEMVRNHVANANYAGFASNSGISAYPSMPNTGTLAATDLLPNWRGTLPNHP